nr:aminoglycoside phosphotransferase family protein [Streptomyces sp. HNM0575]
MRRTRDGREWLEQLPSLIEEFSERWQLRLGAPYHGGSCSWVAPALRADGTRAVLKVTWPHREARPEGAVLKLWAGHGAVRVYEHDPDRYALLLERCEPGTELRAARELPAEERLLIGARVLRQLWEAGPDTATEAATDTATDTGAEVGPDTGPDTEGAPRPPSLEHLSAVAADWANRAEERTARYDWPAAADTGLLAHGAELLRELPLGAGRKTVLHGDFNPGNLLAAEREPWLAIDTKPMYGDPAFDPWPLIQQIDDPFALPEPQRVLARRTSLVAGELGVDVAHLRTWAVARHVEFLLWCLDGSGDLSEAVRMSGQVRVLAGVAGL